MANLLITGGAGFIGSHTCLVLLEAGHTLLLLDNFSHSSPLALRRMSELSGQPLRCIEGDVRNSQTLKRLFANAEADGTPIEAVIHFAGLKAVGESVADPLRYWDVNVCGSLALLSAMDCHGCHTLVFSSSATLYGYPVGAHPSGRIGEDPLGIPNNLFPFISQVAVGTREQLRVFGGDWPTPDGSGIRDYIHVMDLAEGHLAALNCLLEEPPQLLTLNLGSGRGASVLEVVRAFEAASGRSIPYTIVDRRQGDAAITVADPTLARSRLNWRTTRSLSDICRDGWAWQSANPQGYREAT